MIKLRRRHALSDRAAMLQRLPELSRLTSSSLNYLATHFDEVVVERGAVLAAPDHRMPHYVVLLHGLMRLSTPISTAVLKPGDSAGWNEMHHSLPSRTSVVALEESRVLVTGRAGFRAVRAAVLALAPAGAKARGPGP